MFTANYDSSTRRYLSVAVYTVFFIVHLFCIPGPSIATIMPASLFGFQKINNKEKSIEDNADAGDVNKIKLNISKRFQHAEGDIELHSAETSPVIYFDKTFAGKPQHYLLISHILVSSLRGPPSFA